MTRKTTELTRQDLKIYASQRLTDTPDGGGPMSVRELTGAANELFAPVSDVERTMGGFDARLVYPAVLRNDTAALLGGHVVLSEPPEADNVSVLLFPADYYGQTRASAMERIEAYAVPTIENRMTLLGTQRKGSRMVQVYQRENAPLPLVGQTFALRIEVNRQFVYEFVRVEKFVHELRTFEDEKGEFVRRVIGMTVQQALERDFEGVEDASRYKAAPPARVLDTQVADSGKYYGIKPLAEALTAGSAQLKVDSIYEQLVPVSTVETAVADDWAQGKEMWIETGTRGQWSYLDGVGPGNARHLGLGILPGSVQTGNYRDNGMGVLSDGASQIYVDYANGILTAPVYTGIGTLTAVPAVKVRNYAYSSAIDIDDTNIGTEWAPLLVPEPARGSVSVSFRAGKEWYELEDPGDYTLRDKDGKVRGSISPQGSCLISLPVMPDSGSKIIVSWVPVGFYKTFDGSAAGTSVPPKTVGTQLVLPEKPEPNLKPGTVRLSWSGGSAQDDGAGKLTGGCTGTVDYASGTVRPVGLNAAEVSLSAQQYSQNPAVKEVSVADGAREMTLVAGALQRGSLKITLTVTRQDSYGYTVRQWNDFHNPSTTLSGLDSRTALVLADDGNGGLVWGGKPLAGSRVDYATGEIAIPKAGLLGEITVPRYSKHQMTQGASSVRTVFGWDKVSHTDVRLTAPATAQVSCIQAPDTRMVSQTADTGLHTYELLAGLPWPNGCVLGSWTFEINGKTAFERNGTVFWDFNVRTGNYQTIGSLSPSGTLRLTGIRTNTVPTVKIIRGLYVSGSYEVETFCGRTAAAPLKPQSFTVYAKQNGQTLSGKAQADERIGGQITGTIDTGTGFFEIKTPEPIVPESLRYNAVSQTSVPLDSAVIGINATRLPSDGRVPIFRRGDMVVISNRLKQDIGSAHSAGQTVSLQRRNLDRLCIVDAAGKHVDAAKYDYDLAAGTLTWLNPLDLSGYRMPLSAVQIWEEENRVSDTDISGYLKLQFGVSRDYPKENTYVSGAIIGGDLQASATEPFSQRAWTNVWQDTRIGEEILAKPNVKDHPVVLTTDGAVTQRWLIRFKSATQFELYGETLGLVAEGDILSDLAPPNPATGKPYFSLPAAAFGGGWAAQNCIRFNTRGTPMPVWILRAIQPSAARHSASDGFMLCLRGNTGVL